MFYKPILAERWFNSDQRYDQIEWTNFQAVVDAFEKRLHNWYIEPATTLLNTKGGGHRGFPVMALCCILIDTLSQFEIGADESTSSAFKAFVCSRMAALAQPVATIRLPARRGRPQQLDRISDVLYHGFRCGILHEAHVPLYGAIDGLDASDVVKIEPSGLVEYAAGGDCPCVVVDPTKLLRMVEVAVNVYLSELRADDPPNQELRANFARKFETSFGVALAI